MSKENVQRFIARVSEDYHLAAKVKAIPAGSSAEDAFVALAREQGLAFSVQDLRDEADRVADTSRAADTGEATESNSSEWVLDYFYGQNRKWTT